MKFISNKKYKKLFLTKSSSFNTKDKVDLILAPEFYWVRKFEIPVKSAKEALKVVPTLFEDILSADVEFSYHVIKDSENLFLCFAYKNSDISEAIKGANLNYSQINRFYFAQNELKKFPSFVINSTGYLYNDEILLKVPQNLLQEPKQLDESLELESSSHKIDVKLYSNILNEKSIYFLTSLFVIIILINAFKYLSYDKTIESINSAMVNIKRENSLPPTKLQTTAIVNSLDKKVQKQLLFRDALNYIMNFKTIEKDGKIVNIKYKDDTIKIEFESINSIKVKEYISKKYRVLNDRTREKISIFEVKI